MAGKTFTNYSHKDLRVTLFIRQSENPTNNAGQTRFDLSSGQREYVGDGDSVNIYLNGITLASVSDGRSPASRNSSSPAAAASIIGLGGDRVLDEVSL